MRNHRFPMIGRLVRALTNSSHELKPTLNEPKSIREAVLPCF